MGDTLDKDRKKSESDSVGDDEEGGAISRFESGRLSLVKQRPQSSSSFHEYAPPERRVPLRERLKQEEEEPVPVVPPQPPEVNNPGKDSLRTRFMRRFGIGNDDRMTDIKEKDEGKSLKNFSFKKKEESDEEEEEESEESESEEESEEEEEDEWR